MSRSFANSWISDRSYSATPTGATKKSRNVVIRRGRVKKRKKNENSHWKDVELLLYPTYLQYSYAKSIFSFTKMKKKSKVNLEDIETVTYTKDGDENSINSNDFIVHFCVPDGETKAPRPWAFRTESSFVAKAWVKEILNAIYRANPLLRERNELKSTSNRIAVSRGGRERGVDTIKDRPRALSNMESDLFSSIVTSTAEYTKSNLSLAITLGGVLEKMSDHRKRWNERFLMYQPEARVFRYRRPDDPVYAWREEHW